ncbi:hypothetical protein PLICRDRAFT_197112 [Plicaturopsis crispa FD-325 SS-3]|nr:hypothetical protein PLICRDRAFT_197112 [Plicaturopsis crispa FD-325 SS-3]
MTHLDISFEWQCSRSAKQNAYSREPSRSARTSSMSAPKPMVSDRECLSPDIRRWDPFLHNVVMGTALGRLRVARVLREGEQGGYCMFQLQVPSSSIEPLKMRCCASVATEPLTVWEIQVSCRCRALVRTQAIADDWSGTLRRFLRLGRTTVEVAPDWSFEGRGCVASA